MNAPPPLEPSADLRAAAAQLRQLYIALLEQRFDRDEALHIVALIAAKGR